MKSFWVLFISSFFLYIPVKAQPMDSLFVVISSDTVNIWNTGAYENCGSLFRNDVLISNDTVYVIETDTSEMFEYCWCMFDLCASMTGLQSGSYIAEIYRKLPILFPDTLFYIGSVSFDFEGSSLPFSSGSYQSDCHIVIEVKENQTSPENISLQQNFPNPFNPSTTIQFSLSNPEWVTLTIFDVLGREIAVLINEEKPTGEYSFVINKSQVELISGVFFYQLKAGNFVQTRKMVVIK